MTCQAFTQWANIFELFLFIQGPQIGQTFEVPKSETTVQKVPGGCSGANEYHADGFTNSLEFSTYNVGTLLPGKL